MRVVGAKSICRTNNIVYVLTNTLAKSLITWRVFCAEALLLLGRSAEPIKSYAAISVLSNELQD